jgi:hypothetical protein
VTRPLQAKIGTQIDKHRKFYNSFQRCKNEFSWVKNGRTYSLVSMEDAIEKHLRKISKKIIGLVNEQKSK